MQKKLTIVITTYNRRLPLLDQLKSIEKQGQYDDYDVIISDNHSDYDVKEWIRVNVAKEFYNIITVISRPYNIGGGLNITLSFQYPKTEWMWLLSDDDITEPGSIKVVLDDIKRHEGDEICWMKYSISGKYKSNKDCVLDNIATLFDYYSSGHSAGELAFMSNNVYRLNYLRGYFSDICMYNDTCVTQVVLPLLAIKGENKKMELRSICLTNYTPNRISYGLLYANIRFGNLLYVLPLKLTKQEIKSFKRISFFSQGGLISSLSTIEDKRQRWELFKKVLASNYSFPSIKVLKVGSLYCLLRLIGNDGWFKLRKR